MCMEAFLWLKHLSGQVPMRAWLPEVLSELRWFTSGGECAISFLKLYPVLGDRPGVWCGCCGPVLISQL